MPGSKVRHQRTGARAALGPALTALALLAGCGQGGIVCMARNDPTAPAGAAMPEAAAQSQRIAELQARRSLLPPGGAYAQVADAVLRADSGASAAQLRMARLKAEARDKNWLPRIGPSVTLSSLSGLAAGLLIDQALFDNGRRKAERAHAAADVEVAAVALATDINARVHDGLVAHVTAERARAQAAVSARALARIEDFARIMDERVAGGLSDRSEAQVIAQKRAEFAAMLASDRQAEAVAAADLAALSGGAASSVRGIDRLAVGTATARPLSVEKAEAEGARAVAEAQMERADLLPGLSAGVNVGTDGIDPGIRLGGGLLGMGTKAEVAALEATGDAMARRSAEAAETAERRIVALQGQIGVLQGREAQGAAVLAETESNLALFAEQYKVGRRSLLELAGQYDSFARLERDQAAIRHEIALIELEIARDRGLLVDGARM